MSRTFQTQGTHLLMIAALTVVHDTDRKCLRAFTKPVFHAELAAMTLREKDACGLLLTEMQTSRHLTRLTDLVQIARRSMTSATASTLHAPFLSFYCSVCRLKAAKRRLPQGQPTKLCKCCSYSTEMLNFCHIYIMGVSFSPHYR